MKFVTFPPVYSMRHGIFTEMIVCIASVCGH